MFLLYIYLTMYLICSNIKTIVFFIKFKINNFYIYIRTIIFNKEENANGDQVIFSTAHDCIFVDRERWEALPEYLALCHIPLIVKGLL